MNGKFSQQPLPTLRQHAHKALSVPVLVIPGVETSLGLKGESRLPTNDFANRRWIL